MVMNLKGLLPESFIGVGLYSYIPFEDCIILNLSLIRYCIIRVMTGLSMLLHCRCTNHITYFCKPGVVRLFGRYVINRFLIMGFNHQRMKLILLAVCVYPSQNISKCQVS